MREQLSRGKVAGIGLWCNGNYAKIKGKDVIILDDATEEWNDDCGVDSIVGYVEIISKTLGEYFGRRDNSIDNKKVFTGDIVKDSAYGALWVVKFSEEHSSFCGQTIDAYLQKKKYKIWKLNQLGPFVIVGNVTDNPELLTEKCSC